MNNCEYKTKGQVNLKTIAFDNNNVNIQSIESLNINNVDVRSNLKKRFFKEKKEEGIFGLLILPFLISFGLVLTFIYAGIEYLLGLLGVKGFISTEQELDIFGFILLALLYFIVIKPIGDWFNQKYGKPQWKWTLQILMISGKCICIETCCPKVLELNYLLKDKLENPSNSLTAKFDFNIDYWEIQDKYSSC